MCMGQIIISRLLYILLRARLFAAIYYYRQYRPVTCNTRYKKLVLKIGIGIDRHTRELTGY